MDDVSQRLDILGIDLLHGCCWLKGLEIVVMLLANAPLAINSISTVPPAGTKLHVLLGNVFANQYSLSPLLQICRGVDVRPIDPCSDKMVDEEQCRLHSLYLSDYIVPGPSQSTKHLTRTMRAAARDPLIRVRNWRWKCA